MSKGMTEPAEVSLGHSTDEAYENRGRKGPSGHQGTETAYHLPEDRLEAESRRQNRRVVADRQPKAEAHLSDD